MRTQIDSETYPREAFRCTGEQLDVIVQFAEERGLENQTLQLVLSEWRRFELG